jgi:hypothetical protein
MVCLHGFGSGCLPHNDILELEYEKIAQDRALHCNESWSIVSKHLKLMQGNAYSRMQKGNGRCHLQNHPASPG